MISIVITFFDPLLKKYNMLADLIRSIGEHSQGKEVELVLVPNANSYVEAVNEGLRRARGEWIVVLNDDVVIRDPDWLIKLCVPGVISSWEIREPVMPSAACFCMDRNVFEKLGYMDERYKDGINYEDTDYFLTALSLQIPFHDAKVVMEHLGGRTFTSYFYTDMDAKRAINKAIFKEKWPKV